MNHLECAYLSATGISEEVNLTTGTPAFSLSFSDYVVSLHLPIQHESRDFISDIGCVTFLGSVDEIVGTWNETVSPNPSSGAFEISWGEYRNVEVVIYNSIGEEVHRSKAKDAFIKFNLEQEQNGVYHYRLLDENGNQSHGKLVLMK